ncbi:BrnA antitoxin family protein [Stenotrophomonas sp. ISL-67]|uniref:BrnA antitoxin family protein n=1 Tax=Stenotrophomonas sp. ISL-67 TaxID=2819171 RepID=UPI001BE9FD5F|nr:BrnA antitoxin family protein [Stenotrophomonas sp. ISL-67]MBT2766139.1 BrnA antitoxin family protein [Stenotrophomonas sp. ISL-67]
MNKNKNSDAPDNDNPEWTHRDTARAVAFTGLPAGLQGKLRGRPKAAETKERITIRLSPDVLEAFRETGAGWQTRIDAVLKDWVVARHGKLSTTVAKRSTVAKRATVAKRPMAAKR